MNAGDRQPPDGKVEGTLIMSSDDLHHLTAHLTVVHSAAQLLLRRLRQGKAVAPDDLLHRLEQIE